MADLSLDVSSPNIESSKAVCFGSLALGTVISTDDYPLQNYGSSVNSVSSYVFQDAAIVAWLLATSGVRTGFIGSAVGDDEAGKEIVTQLKASGISHETQLSNSLSTPRQYVISDSSGGRTWFAERNDLLLETMKNADLAGIANADVLYADWYDGEAVLPPIEYARKNDTLVFLNIEEQFSNDLILDQYVPHTSFCQASLDETASWDDARRTARVLMDAGCKTALVTFGSHGVLVATGDATILVRAPRGLRIIDTCAAGATFSAAFIRAILAGSTIQEAAILGTAAASLKCSIQGLVSIRADEIPTIANDLVVEN